MRRDPLEPYRLKQSEAELERKARKSERRGTWATQEMVDLAVKQGRGLVTRWRSVWG